MIANPKIPEPPFVLVIGAASLDSKGRAMLPLTWGTSTPGKVRGAVGGVARNIADNLTRLGVKAVLLSAIGNDDSGIRILDNANKVGINIDFLMVADKRYRTSAYLALLDEKGNLAMSVDDMEILSCITPEVINRHHELVKNAALIVIDSNLSPMTINAIFKLAKRYQVRVCADPTSAVLVTKLKPYLSEIYMITPNVSEAEVLVESVIRGRDEATVAARSLINTGVKVAIITLGKLGVVYATTDASGYVPAATTDMIDQTGAGDALTATIVFGLLNNISIDEAVRLGATAAAITLSCNDTVCNDLNLEMLYDQLAI